MHQCLSRLPQPLLKYLGAYSRLGLLPDFPYLTKSTVERLRQHNNAQPYHASTGQQGLSLMLQCIDPKASPQELVWGLQGFTLQAGAWEGAWPAGMDANTATAKDVVALLSEKPEEVMNMPPMVCFGIQGTAGQTWSVMAVFNASGKLDTFSLLRVGPWRGLEALPS